jgi:hypothetical protein
MQACLKHFLGTNIPYHADPNPSLIGITFMSSLFIKWTLERVSAFGQLRLPATIRTRGS